MARRAADERGRGALIGGPLSVTMPTMLKKNQPPTFPATVLPIHPSADASAGPPCHQCTALCCRYFALQLDTPEDAEDFDSIRWYLMHGTAWIWVDDGDWYLQVDEACRFLGAENECTIYDKRPQICRDYGLPEKREDPEEPLCDYFAQDAKHDLEFRDPDEFQAWVDKFLAEKQQKRARRSDAAKRAWARRRAGVRQRAI